MSKDSPILIIVMGASGCGKSSIGLTLAQSIKSPLIDADDLHPIENVNKMASGKPLNDQDRLPWLHKIRHVALILTSTKGVKRLSQASSSTLSTSTSTSTVEESIEIKDEELEYAIEKVHPGSLHPPQSVVVENDLSNSTDGDKEDGIRKRGAIVVACSALKLSYRDLLRGTGSEGEGEGLLETYFIYLHGTRSLLLKRMENRPGHFMKSDMLDSQLSTLESPNESIEFGIGRVRLGKGDEGSEERGMKAVVEDAVQFAEEWLKL